MSENPNVNSALTKILDELSKDLGMFIKVTDKSITKMCQSNGIDKKYSGAILRALTNLNLGAVKGEAAGMQYKIFNPLTDTGTIIAEIHKEYLNPSKSLVTRERKLKDPQVVSEVRKVKEYHLGQEVYVISSNKIFPAIIKAMTIDPELTTADLKKGIKNNNITYTLSCEDFDDNNFKVTEFSDSIDGLLSLLKQQYLKSH